MIRGLKAKALLADKGYVSNDFRRHVQRRCMKVVIPPKSNAKRPHKYSKYLYKQRNRIERCFNKLKLTSEDYGHPFRPKRRTLTSQTVTLAAISLWLRAIYVD